MFHILFVCTGNICRSPLAEVLLRSLLSPRASEFSTVSSAGTGAMDGMRASESSVRVAREHGLDLSAHRSTPLTRRLIDDSDLILTMSAEHRRAVLAISPAARDRTFVLGAFAEGEEEATRPEVPDPIGGDLEAYRNSWDRIERLIKAALPRVEERIHSDSRPRQP
jgi:protein-tyrosine-phosphatase